MATVGVGLQGAWRAELGRAGYEGVDRVVDAPVELGCGDECG